ncbi:pentapeptide repeat-containing protein [Streptomyces sp. S07_1.15]|uniref:pentapeptide repeat-containing protein n=1 Tax=Streptomyces sp. S07_1.15 TaxID=2873925 RepID=UPI0027E1412C|nr:pentapeptide repeat-containing protein [Streptomyces sp. S07_1.15]
MCLAHLAEADRAAYLAALVPGADLDHCGTPFTTELLNRLLDALHDPATGRPRLGTAWFGGSVFTGEAQFDRATFSDVAGFEGATFARGAGFEGATFARGARFVGATFAQGARFVGATFSNGAWFRRATFAGEARFDRAAFTRGARFGRATFARVAWFGRTTFSDVAWFGGATFSDVAWFDGAAFTGEAQFDKATFSNVAWFRTATFTGGAHFGRATFTRVTEFGGATFSDLAWFDGAAFTGEAQFGGVTFTGDARFGGVRFEAAGRLGPLVCGGTVMLDGAVFGEPVTVEAAARAVTCGRARWASAATLRLRYAELDLSDAVLEYPLTVTARSTPFTSRGDETLLSHRDSGVRLISVDGVDAAHLVLHDIDLGACRFAGAVHLDQLRVDGWCTFATTPTGVRRHRLFPRWWSLRSTLAEEHHWRARRPRPTAAWGWTPAPRDTPVLKPAALAALYRQLRKSLEDGKNEPDAADFYYGECEMRRHDTTRSRGERALLTAYWMLSGYGLRAGRALAWLLGAMTVTLLVLLLWGLPVDDPKPTTTGRQVAVGQKVMLTTDTPDPVNPTGPWPERVTTERFEKALRVVINSVVFRSSGQDLTTAGTYTEMASRLAEPVLLGLAVLAIRSRVKR